MTYTVRGAQAQQRFGALLAKQLLADDVLLLYGDLGAGKSELTRGIAKGLGTPGYITSPTFTILQVHEGGRLALYHFDWYRVSGAEELWALNLDEYLHMGGVAAVEWPDQAPEVIPESYLRVEIEAVSAEERRITLTPVGGFRALLPIDWEERVDESVGD